MLTRAETAEGRWFYDPGRRRWHAVWRWLRDFGRPTLGAWLADRPRRTWRLWMAGSEGVCIFLDRAAALRARDDDNEAAAEQFADEPEEPAFVGRGPWMLPSEVAALPEM